MINAICPMFEDSEEDIAPKVDAKESFPKLLTAVKEASSKDEEFWAK
jgi:hypothetical protein